MEIKVIRVPQFMSKKVNVIMVDGKPLCTCRGNFTTQSIIARLQGYDVEIKDGRILKLIESENEQDNGNDW